jgi:hypothetical protein
MLIKYITILKQTEKDSEQGFHAKVSLCQNVIKSQFLGNYTTLLVIPK